MQTVSPISTAAQIVYNYDTGSFRVSSNSVFGSSEVPCESVSSCGQVTGLVAAKSAPTAIKPYYPANQGFLGETSREFLYAGQRIDRYGGTASSRFFSPAGTPATARSLPPGTASQSLRSFEVVKPFEVESGTVAPYFGEIGYGTQYRDPVNLETLLGRGILREVTP
jgi:hypothetical protein